MSFAIIVAADEANGIGKACGLPWHLPGDMAFYKRTTIGAPEGKRNVVIMGRKTWDSIPLKFRPLKDRENVVVTRAGLGQGADRGALQVDSLDRALRVAETLQNVHRVFVIGGGEIYREALARADCEQVLLTRVHARFDCDTQLPPFEHAFARVLADGPHRDGEVSYTFETYERRV